MTAPLRWSAGPGQPVIMLYPRRAHRAKRISLRIVPGQDGVQLTLPPGVSVDQALQFVASRADWIAAQLARQPAPVPFISGACLPMWSGPAVLEHRPDQRQPVHYADGKILVGGPLEVLDGRVRRWLRRHAQATLRPLVAEAAEHVQRPWSTLRITDARSRWGSCSSRGTIALSWRLILAPQRVARYVAAHEAAHLVHMHHGPAFWKLVDQLHDGWRDDRAWLRSQGGALHRFGQSGPEGTPEP